MAASEFKAGIIFSAVAKYSNMVIQILVNAVLSRILTPADYGIVAIVQIFLAFFNMLADMGFGPAIIQNKMLDNDDVRVIFKFSLYIAVILGFIFMLLGYPVSLFYNNMVFTHIFIVLGISIFFHSLFVVPRAILLKQKDFKSVNLVVVVAGIIKGIVSIILAFLGFKYYAIIIGGIVQAGITFVIYYLQTKISPRVNIRREPLEKIWKFSRDQFSFNFIHYFSRNLDSILIGRYINPTQLAFYNKSYQISLYPNQLLAGIVTPVIQPIMSDYQHKKEYIKETYLRITRILGNIGVPLSVFCFFAASDIIIFIFGDQWHQSVPSFRILAVSIWIQMIASSSGAFYQSTNRTDLLLFSGIQSMVFDVVAIIYGIYLGTIESVAAMLVISFSLNFIVNNYLLMYKVFDSNYKELIKSLVKPLLLGAMQVGVFILLPELPFSLFVNLVIKVLIFIFIFFVGLLVTKQYKEVKEMVFN